jgi:hypothetical protein
MVPLIKLLNYEQAILLLKAYSAMPEEVEGDLDLVEKIAKGPLADHYRLWPLLQWYERKMLSVLIARREFNDPKPNL